MPDQEMESLAPRLLVVDAHADRRTSLAAVLERRGYGVVLGCEDLEEAIESSEAWAPDLFLIDLESLAGSAAGLAELAAKAPGATLGLSSAEGAPARLALARPYLRDFLIRPFGIEELGLRIDAILDVVREQRLIAGTSRHPLAASGSAPGHVEEGLTILAAIADYHDDDTNLHAQRVGVAAAAIAGAMDLPVSFVELLRAAAPLHDIGKVGISRRILLKPDKLTPNEWLHMTAHVEIGAQLLAGAQAPVFHLAAEIARTHHERWDGTGYSAGLRGEQIPLSGRIVAVADTWDTLLSERPYRAAWSPERAWSEILADSETRFDPDVVAAFASLDSQELSPHLPTPTVAAA